MDFPTNCNSLESYEWMKKIQLTQYFSIPMMKAAAISENRRDFVGVEKRISLDGVGVAFRDDAGVFHDSLVFRYRRSTFRQMNRARI